MSLLTFVPAGMVELMKDLSKNVIKDRPQNIYEFAAEFFERMLIERDGSLDKGYGKFRSYTEYCKFMDKMEQRRLKQPINTCDKVISDNANDQFNLKNASTNELVAISDMEIQGVAIPGVERKTKDYVKNVSMNPKYKSQNDIEREIVMKPVVSGVKNVKPKPRKLSSKKPSENLIVIKEETSTDIDDVASNEDPNLRKAAVVIQRAVRKYLTRKGGQDKNDSKISNLSENAAALVIQKAFKLLINKLKSSKVKTTTNAMPYEIVGQENATNSDKIINDPEGSSEPKQIKEDVRKQDMESNETQLENKLSETVVKLDKEYESNQIMTDDVHGPPEPFLGKIKDDEVSKSDNILGDESKQNQPKEPSLDAEDVEIKSENQIAKETSDDDVANEIKEFKQNQHKSDTSNVTKGDQYLESKNKENQFIEHASDDASLEADMSSNQNQLSVDTVTSSKTDSDVEQLQENTSDIVIIQPESEFIQKMLTDCENEDKVGLEMDLKVDESENISVNIAHAQDTNDFNQRKENATDDTAQTQEQQPQQQSKEMKFDPEHLTDVISESITREQEVESDPHKLTSINANNTTATDDTAQEQEQKESKFDPEILTDNTSESITREQVVESNPHELTSITENNTTTADDTAQDQEQEQKESKFNPEILTDVTSESITREQVVESNTHEVTSINENNTTTTDDTAQDQEQKESKFDPEILTDVISESITREQGVESHPHELTSINKNNTTTTDDTAQDQEQKQQQKESKCDPEHLIDVIAESITSELEMESKQHELMDQSTTVNKIVASNENLASDVLKNISKDATGQLTIQYNKNEDLKRENDQLSPSTEQIIKEKFSTNLFTVKNEEIYVNLDVLEEKLGKNVINDTGSDSEKSFKLNIHEREEILVNQENMKHIEDDQPLTMPEPVTGALLIHCVENEENYSEEKTDAKAREEVGNEEYELAETVVLDDIRVQHNTEDKLQVSGLKTIIIDSPDSLKNNLLLKQSSNNAKKQKFLNIDSNEEQTDYIQPYNWKQGDAKCSIKTHPSESTENIVLLEQKDQKFDITPTTEPDSNTLNHLKMPSDVLSDIKNLSEDLSHGADSNNKAIVKQNIDGTEIKDHLNSVATTLNTKTATEQTSNSENDASINKPTTEFEIKDNEAATNDPIRDGDTKSLIKDSIFNIIEGAEQYGKYTEPNIVANDNLDKERNDQASLDDQLLKSAENEKLAKAATVIQKVFRGYIVRKPKVIDSSNESNKLKLSAALTIQKYVRGYLARTHLNKINNAGIINVKSNEKNEGREDIETIGSDSIPIADVAQPPTYSNRFLIPKDSFLERESFADDEDYARTCKELAATSIQKTYRGYRVRRSLKDASGNDFENISTPSYSHEIQNSECVSGDLPDDTDDDHEKTIQTEEKEVIAVVLSVAADVLPLEAEEVDVSEHLPHGTSVSPGSKINKESKQYDKLNEPPTDSSINETNLPTAPSLEADSILGQIVADNIYVEGQMQQKYNCMAFQDNKINPIEELSDSSEPLDTPTAELVQSKTKKSMNSVDSTFNEVKSFSYEQLSSDLSSDTEDIKRESLKESEIDETSRDERDDLSEVENFDLSSCGEDSLEAMYYSIRKSEIMLDKMQKHAAERRDSKNEVIGNVVEFPERVTETLDEAMKQVFKSVESSSDYDGDKKDEGEESTTLDIGLDDGSSINDEKEIETSRHIKRSEVSIEQDVGSDSTDTNNIYTDAESNEGIKENTEDRKRYDGNFNTSDINSADQDHETQTAMTRSMIKSQSVSDDMMNPIMFAMKRKQALLDQLHVRPYPLQENLSEDHDAFPDHLLSDMDLGNIQRKIFASSISETDSDYIEPTSNKRLVRDDFNISTALDHLSTDSDSTVSMVSAATKIQAGARGFLTRRRLQRTSVGDTSISFEKRYSFGNAAIDKSLEDLIKRQEQINLDGAALKIQQQFRKYRDRKRNLKKVSPIREQTLELSDSSGEGNDRENIGIRDIKVAQKQTNHVDDQDIATVSTYEDENQQKNSSIDEVNTVPSVKTTPINQRRQTLQRGDAVQRNSQPDSPEVNVKSKNGYGSYSDEKFKDSETGEYNGSMINRKDAKVTSYINIQSLINRGIGPRQRSMPVQIDSELMRIIPKHLRKRVKSADIIKKKNH